MTLGLSDAVDDKPIWREINIQVKRDAFIEIRVFNHTSTLSSIRLASAVDRKLKSETNLSLLSPCPTRLTFDHFEIISFCFFWVKSWSNDVSTTHFDLHINLVDMEILSHRNRTLIQSNSFPSIFEIIPIPTHSKKKIVDDNFSPQFTSDETTNENTFIFDCTKSRIGKNYLCVRFIKQSISVRFLCGRNDRRVIRIAPEHKQMNGLMWIQRRRER